MGLFKKLFNHDERADNIDKTINDAINQANGLTDAAVISEKDKNIPPTAASREVTYYDPPEQHARIIIESFRIIESTTNPDTFFYRCKLAADEACHISDVSGEIYNGMSAREIYEWFYDKEAKTKFQKEFIDRLFSEDKEDRLAFQMFEVGYRITKDALQYYLDRLDGKKFHFCKVKFSDNSNKTYTYITKDTSLSVGDTVVVKTGNISSPESKVVQIYDTFDAPLDDIEFELNSLRCIESKLKSIKCPNCGASIKIDVTQQIGLCEYCRTQFYLLKDLD